MNKYIRWFPFLLCLCIALLVRIYLLIHSHGVIDGDESLVGIQAQHILQGERPIYFYGQAYMGSLEAYGVALLFALFGASVYVARLWTILLSLVLVAVTWQLATVLARRAKLSTAMQTAFVWCSTLGAAILPLYDMTQEMHLLGGYIEVFLIMQLLLLAALRLADRWQERAHTKELALRWAGLGFLVGLGFWVDPLVIVAVAAIGLWLVPIGLWLVLCLIGLIRAQKLALPSCLMPIVAIPAALVGAAPALYWGALHNWQNVTYIMSQGSTQPLRERLRTIRSVGELYQSCIGPRVIGGRVPLAAHDITRLYFALYWGSVALIIGVVALVVVSWVSQTAFAVQVRRLAGLPLLFALCSVGIFCVSGASTVGLVFPCESDFVGRYASPILLVLPLLIAAGVICLLSLVRFAPRFSRAGQGLVIAGVLVSLLANLYTYTQSDSRTLFQSPYCNLAPANNDAIIAYMEREHITRAWGNVFIANPINFKTGEHIIVADPIAISQAWLNRMPAYLQAVEHANKPSILYFVKSNDVHPGILQHLEQDHITYRVARFTSQPGVDVLVITPLNRSVPVASGQYGLFVCVL